MTDQNMIRVGLIDDDSNKLVNLKANLKSGFDDSSVEKKQKYSNIKFNPIDLKIKDHNNDILDIIMNLIKDGEIDALFIDYKLSTYSKTTLNGVEISRRIQENYKKFPIFIMTAYDDDLFQNEFFSPLRVFDSARYLNEETERDEIHVKIVQEVYFHMEILKKWENEIIDLLSKKELTDIEKDHILELDSNIEEYLYTKGKLTAKQKSDMSLYKLEEIASNVEKILLNVNKK